MAKHYMVYSFVLTSLGAKKTARRYLAAGETAASETGDPVTYAHALQLRAAVTCWAGNVQESLELGARSLIEYGRWRELSEYLLTAYNQQQLEALRGRSQEAWQWLERAISRLVKHHGPRLSVEFIELSARAALTALGREREADALIARLSAVRRTSGERAMVSVSSYGSRARRYTESGDLGVAFEELVTEVEAQRFNPKRVHLEVTEYYVHVAHARVHACLRATPAQLRNYLPKLRRAFSDLDRGARISLLHVHALVIKAYIRYFEGDLDTAARLFSQAEDQGATEAAPWILYAAHRGRAHLLRRRGLVDAAQDQARLAEALAKKHRAAYRLRWIRQEFELSGYSSSERTGSSGSIAGGLGTGIHQLTRHRGYLKSLLRIDQQTDLSQQQQARVIIDELLTTLTAERGYLFLATE
jgi:hypothetical protein